MQNRLETVVFPVAGLGTRFLPATKAVPKEMLPVVDRPLIQCAVEEAAQAGCTHFIFVTAPEKQAIMQHFSAAPHYEENLKKRDKADLLELLHAGLPQNARISEVVQDEPLGLGHAIWCARNELGDKPFAVILPDDMVLSKTPCLQQMVQHYPESGGQMIAVEPVPYADTARYGVIAPGEERARMVAITNMVEKPEPAEAPSNLAIIGRYILDSRIIDVLGEAKTGAGGEIQLTDAIGALVPTLPSYGFRFSGTRYDCGTRKGFLLANIAFALSAYGADMADDLAAPLRDILQHKE